MQMVYDNAKTRVLYDPRLSDTVSAALANGRMEALIEKVNIDTDTIQARRMQREGQPDDDTERPRRSDLEDAEAVDGDRDATLQQALTQSYDMALEQSSRSGAKLLSYEEAAKMLGGNVVWPNGASPEDLPDADMDIPELKQMPTLTFADIKLRPY